MRLFFGLVSGEEPSGDRLGLRHLAKNSLPPVLFYGSSIPTDRSS
jgi:hypothetical protein